MHMHMHMHMCMHMCMCRAGIMRHVPQRSHMPHGTCATAAAEPVVRVTCVHGVATYTATSRAIVCAHIQPAQAVGTQLVRRAPAAGAVELGARGAACECNLPNGSVTYRSPPPSARRSHTR